MFDKITKHKWFPYAAIGLLLVIIFYGQQPSTPTASVASASQCVYKNTDVYDTGIYLCAGKGTDTTAKYIWYCQNGKWYMSRTCDTADMCRASGTKQTYCGADSAIDDATPQMTVGSSVAGVEGVPI